MGVCGDEAVSLCTCVCACVPLGHGDAHVYACVPVYSCICVYPGDKGRAATAMTVGTGVCLEERRSSRRSLMLPASGTGDTGQGGPIHSWFPLCTSGSAGRWACVPGAPPTRLCARGTWRRCTALCWPACGTTPPTAAAMWAPGELHPCPRPVRAPSAHPGLSDPLPPVPQCPQGRHDQPEGADADAGNE